MTCLADRDSHSLTSFPPLPRRDSLSLMKSAVALSLLLFSSSAIAADTPSVPYDWLTQRFAADVKVLASDATEGRAIGTKGIEIAASFIESELKSLHLQPAFDGSYRQTFPIKTGVVMKSGNSLEGVPSQDWTPLGFSSAGAFSGELAFVGYGIEAPRRRLQRVRRHRPEGQGRPDAALRAAGEGRGLEVRRTPAEPLVGAALQGSPGARARRRGRDLRHRPAPGRRKDKLPVLRNDGPESPAGIPVLQVKPSVAPEVARRRGHRPHGVPEERRPRSQAALASRTGVRITGPSFSLKPTSTSSNLAGILPGKGASPTRSS